MPKQAVRCKTCWWTGSRQTDLPLNAVLPKPCPNGHEVVVGGPPPSALERTPSGFLIEFWDSLNIESGQPQTRRYLVDKTKLPSVTTLLRILDKPALLDWAARLAREGIDWRDVRDDGRDRGLATHGLVLDVLTGRRRKLSSVEVDHRPYGQAAMSWVLKRKPEVIDTERLVASIVHGYSGRYDLYAEIDGARVRADYKTVSDWHYKRDSDGNPTAEKLPPYPENALQLDLYEGAAIESGYPPADYGLVVRLGPDGQFEETPFELDPERGLKILGAYRAKADAAKALAVGLRERELAVAA